MAGPTGVGKSTFAAELAQRIGGEIINADAYQIYSGMGTLTSQPDAQMCAAVPHHLYGQISPAAEFSVADYLALARPCVAEIQSRNHRPILVGGTGLYLKAFLYGIDEQPPIDKTLREELQKLSPPDLLARLAKLDPTALELIDLKNPRRILRALEIIIQTKKPFLESRKSWKKKAIPHTAYFLNRNREELHERIETNVRTMFANGVLEEVRELETLTHPISKTASAAIGYMPIRDMLKEHSQPSASTLEELIQQIVISTRQYAKRQKTWFRAQATYEHLLLPIPNPKNYKCRIDPV
ncbi:MAG: tRNA (adenosine(37)-N6)-dimethylallyltransferase MiaA [Chthoniobacterales bacterium]